MRSTTSTGLVPVIDSPLPTSALGLERVSGACRDVKKLSDIEQCRRNFQTPKPRIGFPRDAFSPEYQASWNDVDEYDHFYFRQQREEGVSSFTTFIPGYLLTRFCPEERIKQDVERALRAQRRARERRRQLTLCPTSVVDNPSSSTTSISPHCHSSNRRTYILGKTATQIALGHHSKL